MSLVLQLLKNFWPILRVGNRTPVSRSTYLLGEDSANITAETGEAITTE